MRHEARRLVLPLVLCTIGLVIALGLQPVSSEEILAAYVLALAALGLELATRVLAARSSSEERSAFAHALHRSREEPTRPTELVRIERELTLGIANAGHLHLRLLPLLRDIATARLGFDLRRSPDRARTLLGDDVWELLRPDRPAPEDRNGPGAAPRQVERCIDVLERA